MKTYQTLSLIGCIFGILITFAWSATIGAVTNIVGGIDTFGNALVGLFFGFMLYIILLALTFTMKTKTKALGIILIVVGFIAMLITNLWGLIAFALLLPAGILAIREAKRRDKEEEVEKRVTTEEQRTETGGERKRSSSFTEGWGDDKK